MAHSGSESPQDVYARNLLSHRGYPLRTPEPNIELPDGYRQEGLKIGDVGVVVPDDGSFDVFFNITLPREHPLHAVDGVPDSFTQFKLRREDCRVVPDAESPGRVISAPTVACDISCVDPFYLDDVARRLRLTEHRFSLHQNEGAMLILPQGAERHRLAKDLLLLDTVLQNAVDWYRFAREKLYRDITNDALYVITGFHKAQSWSLASFKDTGASAARCKIVQTRKAGPMLSDDSTWETTHPLEWRIGPRHLVDIPNQSVFITGFKIAVNTELLYMQRVTVKVGHSKRTLRTTLVGFGASLANLLVWSSSGATHSSEAVTQDEEADEQTPEHDSSGDKPPKLVKVERVPQISQPFHPSDIINQYMFKKEPSAKIAITHDSQWIDLLEKGILKPQDMLQEGLLEATVSREYNIITKDEAVYLQSIGEPTNMYTPAAGVSTIDHEHHIVTGAQKSTRSMLLRRNIVFFGETGTGKSSAINLLMNGTFAPVSNDSQPCTQDSTCYRTTLCGTEYNLWDTRGLGEERNFFQTVRGVLLGGTSEQEFKKFLKERHGRNEIDLLVYCVRASKATQTSEKYYKAFCDITRRLAAPVVIVVTHLEREANMEDWWKRNSGRLKELKMEFDGHICITTLPGHPRLAESRNKLVQLITRVPRWEAKENGSYFDSPVQKSALPRGGEIRDLFNGKPKSLQSHRSSSLLASPPPSSPTEDSSYHTATPDSPAQSTLLTQVVEPPTPRSEVTPVHINTNLPEADGPPQPSSSETFTVESSLHSMFNISPYSSSTSYSEEPSGEVNDGSRELSFELPAAAVTRRQAWASRSGASGDVWECDLISGKRSRVVAVKSLRVNVNDQLDLISHEKKFHRELKIWEKLQHRNVVPLLGVVSGFGPWLSMVSPWFPNGSLSHYLWTHKISMARKHSLLRGVAVGLRYLHSQDIVHGNLHSDNVLIHDDGTACLTDIGLSFIGDFLGTSYLKSGICGGVNFADPALVQRANNSVDDMFYPTKPCDIYSFGGVMLHVLSGRKPYHGIPQPTIFVMVLKGERPQIPVRDKDITPGHKSLIRTCWDPEEHMRPTAEELVMRFDRQ